MTEKPKELEDFFIQTIEQSVNRHQLDVSGQAKDYIATMLLKFADTLQLFPEQNAGIWLEPLTLQCQRIMGETNALQRKKRQQELGDHCLFLTGYFYDFLLRHGQANVGYYALIGSTAYQQTGQFPLVEMSQKFNELYLVIGDLHLPQLDEKKVLEIYDKWLQTGDRYYASLLLGKGIVPQRITKGSN